MAVPSMLEAAGVDATGLLAGLGLTTAYFDDPENVIPFATAGTLLRQSAEQTACPHFGLLAGQRSGILVLGTVGYLAQSAPDVQTALKELTRYLHVHDAGAVVTFSVEGAFASLGYAILVDRIEGAEQILDAATAIMYNILRGLCGAEWVPSAVELTRARPVDAEPYRKVFGVMPRFEADQSAVVFPSKWLTQPLISADPLLHRLMRERAGEQHDRTRDTLALQARRVIRPLLGSPACSLAIVAGRLGMHERTLNRRLAAEGTNFRRIREDVRLEAACQLLENSDRPVFQVADVLGYSDATAFTRAFRRWAGVSPAQWRRERDQDRRDA
jgi:AraC-like DNA-binding protein